MVSLGANLGDRLAAMAHAIDGLLQQPGTRVVQSSAIYETAPWGTAEQTENQPWYLNAVVEIDTLLTPTQLLAVCQQLELHAGRLPEDKRPLNAPRTLDVDILWCQQVPVLTTEQLTLPHPRFHTRACTLVPLLEHWADWQHPVTGHTLVQHHVDLPAVEPVKLHSIAPWVSSAPASHTLS